MNFQFRHISEESIEIYCEGKSLELYSSLEEYLILSNQFSLKDSVALPHLLYINYQINQFDLKILKEVLAEFNEQQYSKEQSKPVFRLPVCFDEEFAADKYVLEKETGLTFEEILKAFKGSHLTASMYGFIPGFVYLKGLDRKLHLPRKSKPSQHIQPGSVAIAKNYAGIYPTISPGGWYVIGRTPVKIFDKEAKDMFAITPGQKVQIIDISKQDFENYE